MVTTKQIREQYIGTEINGETIVKTTNFKLNDKPFTILMSDYKDDSLPYGVCVEAIIDRSNGENVIAGKCRPADNMTDAVDVALEMLSH